MNTFEINKIVGAVLAAMLTAMIVGQIATALVSVHELEENVYIVRGADDEMQPDTGDGDAEMPSIGELLASANVADGGKVTKKCTSCHSFDDGGPDKIGPNLWNIVNRPIASNAGFAYSAALADKGGEWTYENLDEYLLNPKAWAPGTKMAFAGLKKAGDRADLIAWLREQSPSPAPLPVVEAKAEPEAASDATEAPAASEEAPAESSDESAMPADDREAVAPAAETTAAPAEPEIAESTDTSTEAPAAETAAPAEPEMAEPDTSDASDAAAPAAATTDTAAPAEPQMAESDTQSETTAATDPAPTQEAAATAGPDLAALFASADPAAGQKGARKCIACHNVAAGKGNKIGPNLWNIVDRPVASVEGYKYSPAMIDFGGDWTYARLYEYLKNPKGTIKGTKMAFPGVKKDQDLVNLLAWLGEQSDNPVPPPK